MRFMAAAGLGLMVLAGASSSLAQGEIKAPHIVVSGFGRVETPAATADIGFGIAGEGVTADDATKAFLARRKSIEDALARLGLDPKMLHSGQFSVSGVRGKECETERYDQPPHLSTGACAIVGYLAKAEMTLTVGPAEQAGTVVALVARLGADDAKTERFNLSDDADAHKRATTAAFANANALAQTIAASSHVHLGPLISVQDADIGSQEIVVTGSRGVSGNAAAPLKVSLTPRPIETSVRLTVVYAIQP